MADVLRAEKVVIQDAGTSKCLLKESVINDPKTDLKPGVLGMMEGVCSDFNEATRNGNFYSKRLWENVLKSDYYKEAMETRTLIGELDHPWDDRLEISAQEAAIRCVELNIDEAENNLKGKFEVLDTPRGQILNTLLKSGMRLGVSSRGVGDLEPMEDGNNRVDEDNYLFVCFDAVVQPAAVKARQNYTSLTESEKRKVVPVLNSLLESLNKVETEKDLTAVNHIAEKVGLKENKQFKEQFDTVKSKLKLFEKNNIIKKNRNLSKDLQQAYEKINKLEERLSHDTVSADVSFIKAQIKSQFESLKNTVENSNNGILEEYKKVLSENKNLQKELMNLENRISKLDESGSVLEGELKDTKKALTEKSNKIAELTNIVDYARNLVKTCKKQIIGLQESNKTLQESNDSMNNVIKEQKSVISKIAVKNKKLTESVNESNRKINNVKNSTRLSQNLLLEYLNQKEMSYGTDLSLAKSEVLQAKSLKEVDLIISKIISKKKRPNTESIMSALKESYVIENSDTEVEENSVIKQAYRMSSNSKN